MAGDKKIQYKGVSCYYQVVGKGKPVMLVHGFIEDAKMWDGLLPSLQKSFKLITPDLPGFGKSVVNDWNRAAGEKGLTMEWYAGYLKAIADAEKLKSFTLLGHSMGGYITLYYAEKFGKNLNAFGLVNSHCYEDTPDKKANRLKGIDFIKQYGTAQFVTELYYNIFHEAYIKKNRKVVEQLIERAKTYRPDAVMAANRAMMLRADKSQVLKNAKVPVLMIGGKEDPSAPLDYVLKQASLPSICDIHLFAECKHMSVFEKKKEVIKIISNFCEG